jgi:hypothetical protein
MALCLADHNGLDQIANDRHKMLLSFFVAIVTG